MPEPTHKQAQRHLTQMATALLHVMDCHERYCKMYGPGIDADASCLKDARARLDEYYKFLSEIRN